MKIKLLVARAGVGFSQNRGDIITVKAAEGRRMIEAEQAVEVGARGKTVERTVKTTGRKKKA